MTGDVAPCRGRLAAIGFRGADSVEGGVAGDTGGTPAATDSVKASDRCASGHVGDKVERGERPRSAASGGVDMAGRTSIARAGGV